MKINKDLQLAVTCHRRGDLTQAEALYKKALKKQPNNIDILHMLGGICYQLGDIDGAIRYIRKEIELTPSNADAHFNLAFVLQITGQPDEAIMNYRKVIEIAPDLVEAYNNIGILLSSKGRLEEAITYFQKAIGINPHSADIYNNLGLSLKDKGEIDEAIINYRKAIHLSPDFADAYYNLGVALQGKKQLDEAMNCYKKAIQCNPDYATAYNNLGTIYHEEGQFHEAIDCYQNVVKLQPDSIDAYFNLANVMRAKGDLNESLLYSKRILELNPHHAETHFFNIASLHLLNGDFEQGWKEYEWRWKLKDYVKRAFSQPFWDGSDITGKTILLYTEQGFGDAIHFIRYVPLVAQRGARVILVCPNELKSLLKTVQGVCEVVVAGEPLPEFDVHCPLLSLPLKFNTTLDTIPAEIPYIKADTALVQKWRDKVRDEASKFKVGLVWAGSPKFKGARIKACSLETLSVLSLISDITFYSLQKGDAAEQAKSPPQGMNLIDYTEDIHDFSDTAALIENLDLVISVDTAVAHLAGAMGKPVWTLIPFAPDWRWMLNREDSPWYPTMRLFRQSSPGDWQSVISRVEKEIYKLIKSNSGSDEY